jgi:hypothetical protein
MRNGVILNGPSSIGFLFLKWITFLKVPPDGVWPSGYWPSVHSSADDHQSMFFAESGH